MENTDYLPDNTPVEIRTGSYKGRTGSTCGKPGSDGLYYVQLPARQPRTRSTWAYFTRAQMQDLSPAAASTAGRL